MPSDSKNFAERKPFQFSLRTLLTFMCLVALGSAMIFALPAVVSFFLLRIAIATWVAILTTVAVWGNTEQKAFGVGALILAGTALYELTVGSHFSFAAFVTAALSVAVGHLCVQVQHWLDHS